ncbi:HD domain-containing protein [Ruminococcus sp. 5_1_39BFAA]|uniref:HD domain-containing protein n=1 Tax=Ruminococcus sp. 5_1_39BFAA TaxID=457412 RepID=UPI003562049D
MSIDFAGAREAFEEYLNEYDREDEKIKLKIVHTYGVIGCAREITRRMELSQEDRELAAIIALLHDIGRFEQIKLFDSFQPDTMDHAAFGAKLLFEGEKPMIRRFVREDCFDEIIHTAIAKHSDFKLEGIADKRTLLHAKLIRDADKLDNCRVKLVESVETMLGMDKEAAGKGKISPKVWESCMKKESVLSADRQTGVDYWVSYVAQYYDVNFPETWEIIKEKNYVRRIVERLHYKDPETFQKMEQLTAEMEAYMESEICRKV